MFATLKLKLLLGVYIFIILSIPIGAYLASETQVFKSKASEDTPLSLKATPKPTTSPAKKLLEDSQSKVLSEGTGASPDEASQPEAESSSPTIANSFGPTLSFKVTLEGRPADKQNTKLFVGIYEGTLSSNLKFILSFSVDLPESGEYSNLSLAGLTAGSKYTALLKGQQQLAAASEFLMSPTVTNLNDGQPLNMLSGDLNEDNVINSADYSIAQKANGSTPKSANWNGNADLNVDGVVNIFDLSIISKNLGQIGASGAWTSPIPKAATPSASLKLPVGSSIDGSTSGYWIWIPK